MTVAKSSNHSMIMKQLLLPCYHVWFASLMLCQIWWTPVGARSFLVPDRAPKAPGGSPTPYSAPLGAGQHVLEASSDRVRVCLHAAIYLAEVHLVLLTWYPGLTQTQWSLLAISGCCHQSCLAHLAGVLQDRAMPGEGTAHLPSLAEQLALTVPWYFNCRLLAESSWSNTETRFCFGKLKL